MTVREFLEKSGDCMMVKIMMLGDTIIMFDSDYANGIIDSILDLGIECFKINNVSRNKVWCTIEAAVEESVTVTTAEMLQNAMDDESVEVVVLGADIKAEGQYGVFMSSGEKTLDMNGHTIMSMSDDPDRACAAIFVGGGTLTIVGDNMTSVVNGGSGSLSNSAVWVEGAGAKAVIKGGTYYVGLDKDADYNDLIYAAEGGAVEIYDGYFKNEGTYALGETGGVLNIQNGSGATITCYGGAYYNQNPADGDDEDRDTGATFLGEGCAVVTVSETSGMIYVVQEEEK